MRIDHTSLWVSDLPLTEEVYEATLGLTEIWRHEYEDGTIEAFVRGDGGQSLQLMEGPADAHPEPENFDHVTVAVDDLETSATNASEHSDCRLITEESDSQEQSYIIEDPDGYRFEIVQRE